MMNDSHGEEMFFLDHKPVFFKIFINQLTKKRLKIPPEFRDVLKKMTRRVILEVPYGNCWSLKLVKDDEGDVFLGGDWQKFVECNMLQEADFLVFEYDHGARRFIVQIFEKSGLERDYASTPRRNEKVANLGVPNTDHHQHPFFETIIKGYNVQRPFILIIPKSFAEVHFQRAKSQIKLRILDGREWDVNYTIDDGRFVFVGGWPRFVRDNNLKIGNLCRFELIAEKVLRVSISDTWSQS